MGKIARPDYPLGWNPYGTGVLDADGKEIPSEIPDPGEEAVMSDVMVWSTVEYRTWDEVKATLDWLDSMLGESDGQE